jgi:hypothetical protein
LKQASFFESAWVAAVKILTKFSLSESVKRNGGLILRLSQFLLLSQLPQKMKLASKVDKIDSKIIITIP